MAIKTKSAMGIENPMASMIFIVLFVFIFGVLSWVLKRIVLPLSNEIHPPERVDLAKLLRSEIACFARS
jgi:flagellar biogenesis protein FliO